MKPYRIAQALHLFAIFAALSVATSSSAGTFVVAPTSLQWDTTGGFTNQTTANGLDGSGLSNASIVETGDPVPAVWPTHEVWGNNGLASITSIATRSTKSGEPGPVSRNFTAGFDDTYLIDGISLWNWSSSFANGSGVVPNDQARGIAFASIEVSTDGGATFSALDLNGDTVIDALDVVNFSQVPANPQSPGVAPNYAPDVVAFPSGPVLANAIRLNATNFGAGSIIGIGEIRFTAVVPEPTTALLFGLCTPAVILRRKEG